ncbi:hypothetical protein KY337_02835 [Candidatus Woesearchaeota archaeon]|nr:hypothetical protein [Candidatus Woesearchaeota archaeon]
MPSVKATIAIGTLAAILGFGGGALLHGWYTADKAGHKARPARVVRGLRRSQMRLPSDPNWKGWLDLRERANTKGIVCTHTYDRGNRILKKEFEIYFKQPETKKVNEYVNGKITKRRKDFVYDKVFAVMELGRGNKYELTRLEWTGSVDSKPWSIEMTPLTQGSGWSRVQDKWATLLEERERESDGAMARFQRSRKTYDTLDALCAEGSHNTRLGPRVTYHF